MIIYLRGWFNIKDNKGWGMIYYPEKDQAKKEGTPEGECGFLLMEASLIKETERFKGKK